MSKAFPALDFGPLPVDRINAVLGTELEEGVVHMSGMAHRHAAEDHPEDYALYFEHVQTVIADPTFIGQAPKHRENFELIRRVPGGGGVSLLVAVSVEPDDQGRYRVKSVYSLSVAKLETKRAKGTIKIAPLKTTTPPP